jgi:peptide/nickel transport system substrate-binding protein
MILDESTAVAALRTGTLDMFVKMKAPHKESLDQTNPELNSIVYLGNIDGVRFNLENSPLDQLEVRRALWIGTDRAAIARMRMSPDTFAYRYPMGDAWPGWVPFEDLPAEAQDLYTYDVDLAKQMLADAGVQTPLKLTAIGRTTNADAAELLMDQWSKLGIELEFEIIDSAAYSNIYYGRGTLEHDMIFGGTVIHTPVFFAYRYFHSDGSRNVGHYSNPMVDANLDAAAREEDPEQLRLMMEEAFVQITLDASNISWPYTPQFHYWWPWVKNCFGEAWYYHRSADVHNWWLDQELKDTMGY